MSTHKFFLEILYRINAQEPLGKELIYKGFLDILNINNHEKRLSLMSIILTNLFNNPIEEEIVALVEAIASFEGKNFYAEKKRWGDNVVSILGSGKKGFKTFNISTSAGLVAASCGANVLKIGSSATSSISGSMDVLDFLGANLTLPLNKTKEIFFSLGFGFISIENIIPKFDHVYGGLFYAPTILSYILPALVSPIFLDGILYGLSGSKIEIVANLLAFYGFKKFSVVSSSEDNIHFIDEITGIGKTNIIRYNEGIFNTYCTNFIEELKLPFYSSSDIAQGKDLFENTKKMLDSISYLGDINNKNNIVAINSAELLLISGIVKDIEEGYQKSIESIKKNKPINLLKKFIYYTGGNPSFMH